MTINYNVLKRTLSFEFIGNAKNLKWHQWQSKGCARNQVVELDISICNDWKFWFLEKS